MTEINETERAAKRNRVNRLKMLIIIFLFTAILLPIVMCIVMFMRLNSLELELEKLNDQITEARSLAEEAASSEVKNNLPKPEEGRTDEPQKAEASIQISPQISPVPQEQGSLAEEGIRKVYLTFDDGPSSSTNAILDILAEYNVKGTFFVVGREDEASKEALKRIVEEGHTLGMHSYSHKYNQIYESVDAFAADLTKLQDYLFEVTGVRSLYSRFPGGSSNTVSIVDMQVLIRYLSEQGITYFDWNISSGDASSSYMSAQTILSNSTDNLAKHDNAIILMHDAAGKKTTLEALPQIIETILAMENTALLPITDDTEPVQHITITYEGTEE